MRDPETAEPDAGWEALRERWLAAWPRALAAWGTTTRLHAPVLHGPGGPPPEPGVGSFAWFSCTRVEVHIDLVDVVRRGLADHPEALLAHEVGHHVLSPGDLSTAARLLARARLGLGGWDAAAPMVANLWSDLLVNDRLQRRAGLGLDAVWRALGPPDPDDLLMLLVMRADELLWSLPSGTLTGADGPGRASSPHRRSRTTAAAGTTTAPVPVPEAEAQLLARMVRVFADDPVAGAAGFGALVRQLLGSRGEAALGTSRPAVCGQHGEEGGLVRGLAGDPRLAEEALHPLQDPRVVPQPGDGDGPAGSVPDDDAEPRVGAADAAGQGLGVADTAAVLSLLGVTGSAEQAAATWYRERAAPLLVPFPSAPGPRVEEPLLAADEPWDLGDDLGDLDVAASLLRSPLLLPGMTTVQRGWERSDGDDPRVVAVDLDLYLDSSGSMPDPSSSLSPVALAGAVLALSCLRAGGRVQATTWSGPRQVAGTDGFTRDDGAVLAAVVAHFGGGTAFPLDLLERTHARGGPSSSAAVTSAAARPCHVAVVSDDGVTTMFPGEGRPFAGVAHRALEAAGGGGTLLLATPPEWADRVREVCGEYAVRRVTSLEDLVGLCRELATTTWGPAAQRGVSP